MSNGPRHDDWLETYKSLTTLSTEGFKFCALANGGAAVAILAYLGDVAGNDSALPNMSCPMAFFLAGLVLCGASMVLAYLNQLNRLNRIVEGKDTRGDWRVKFGLVLFIFSLLSFAFGSWKAVGAFQQVAPNTSVERDRPTAAPSGSLRSSAAPAAPHLQR